MFEGIKKESQKRSVHGTIDILFDEQYRWRDRCLEVKDRNPEETDVCSEQGRRCLDAIFSPRKKNIPYNEVRKTTTKELS